MEGGGHDDVTELIQCITNLSAEWDVLCQVRAVVVGFTADVTHVVLSMLCGMTF